MQFVPILPLPRRDGHDVWRPSLLYFRQALLPLPQLQEAPVPVPGVT